MSTGERGGTRALLIGASLWTVLMAHLLRLPCRVPGWDAAERLPGLCAPGTAPAGTAGEQPALVGMLTGVLGWFSARVAALLGTDGTVLDGLPGLLLVLAWVGVVAVVSALSGRRQVDAFVLALSPVVVLVGFSAWDLLAVLLMLTALLLHVRGRPLPAGIVLGLAASVALLPLVVLGAVLLQGLRDRYLRDALVVLAGTAATWLLVNGWTLLTAWERLRAGGGSAAVGEASLWRTWARTGLGPEAAGTGAWALPALLLGLAAVLLLVLLARWDPSVVQVSLLLLAVVVLADRQHPLVHALWLLPLVLLARRRWVELAAWQLVEVLWWTGLVLPGRALPGGVLLGQDAQEWLTAARLLFVVWFLVAVAVDVLRGRTAMGGAPARHE
ncbi:glycosyltransferase 87 family protein [Kocuria flava]|uniref:glycosyltransferase 87 family protein n=1 Tax=Kocuria flava TaxID=446860 RepID=UPI002F942841